MKRLRGFRLGGILKRAFKWRIRPRRRPARSHLLGRPVPTSKICALARYLQRGAKRLCSRNKGSDCTRLGQEKPLLEVPKGHLAVYVGVADGDARREVVPVIYFNHPLFGELLKEAERVNGYNHPGGIMLPCRYSEFEKVKTKIEARDCGRRRSDRRRNKFLVVS